MSDVCMVYTWDHTKHAIIQRQIQTLRDAGHRVGVYDFVAGRYTQYSAHAQAETKPSLPFRAWRRALGWVARSLRPWSRPRPNWSWADSARIWLYAARSLPLLLATKADLLQAHDLVSLIPAAIASRLQGRPLIYDAHELAADTDPPGSPRNAALRRLEQRFVPCADRVIVPNQFRADLYGKEYRLRAEPVVIRNCPPMMHLERSDRLRRELGLPPSCRIVVYHGTLMASRALADLVCSARYLDPGIVVVLIGAQTEYYRQVLAPLGGADDLRGKVFFLPRVPNEEVMSYAASADLGVVIYEPLNRNNLLCAPSKMYEYVMAGIPFVGSKLPEILWFLEQFPVGLTLESTEPLCIAATINRFFSDPAVRAELQPQLLGKARERFNWQSEARTLLRLVEQAADVSVRRKVPAELFRCASSEPSGAPAAKETQTSHTGEGV